MYSIPTCSKFAEAIRQLSYCVSVPSYKESVLKSQAHKVAGCIRKTNRLMLCSERMALCC